MKKRFSERVTRKVALLASLLGLGGLLIVPATAGEMPTAEVSSPSVEKVVPDATEATGKVPVLGAPEATPMKRPTEPTAAETEEKPSSGALPVESAPPPSELPKTEKEKKSETSQLEENSAPSEPEAREMNDEKK